MELPQPAHSADLWEGIRARRKEAIEEIWTWIQRLGPPVLRHHGAAASDFGPLLSDALDSTMRFADAKDEPVNLEAFLKWRVRGVLTKEMRKQRKFEQTPEGSDSDGFGNVEVDWELQEALDGCVDELPAETQRAWRLRYSKWRTLGDVARELDRDKSYVAVLLHRARERVWACLTRKGVVE